MKKLLTFTAIAMLSTAAYAADSQDIVEDHGAIAKDNVAIEKQDDNLAVNRAEKAAAKARGDHLDQASQSVQIGANKTAKAAKQTEKHVDEKILEHDKKNLGN